MTSRDWKEVMAWAAVTAVVTVGTLAGRVAVSDGTAANPAPPAATVGNCRVTAAAAGGAPGTVVVTVRVSNATAQKASYAFPVDVVRQEFRGNPWSRVMSAGDFVKENVTTQNLSGGLGPTGHKDVSFVITAPPTRSVNSGGQNFRLGGTRFVGPNGGTPAPALVTMPSANATYLVSVRDGSHAIPLTVFPVTLFAGKS